MKTADFLGLTWGPIEGPLIEPPWPSPVIADPSFLFPDEGPQGDWELFAHSALGLCRYSSPDGLSWKYRGMVQANGMRPFIRALAPRPGQVQAYHLYFEAYPPLGLVRTVLPFHGKWRSKLALVKSHDLSLWSLPQTLLKPDLAWYQDPSLGASASNPCLVQAGPEEWRLYHSASLAYIPDCGFNEPRYLAVAVGPSPEGPFQAHAQPLVDPAQEARPGVLGAGSIKVLRFDDGYLGLQNKIYLDPEGRSRSAIFLLASPDGLSWQQAREAPLVEPQAGWTSSHVYACDCRYRTEDGAWYLYFNARDGWRATEGRERIGRIVGRS